ncbi:class I SAM-dependent methyltransferase [Ectobacillus antri]|jgi:SAM-dependent methyltransferase|uniref:Class I SAM-dependent methyltransferase n=1 Tax=Ectobacillus antri TaxID=2486280 RepID=A0ABT6H1E7_9BACI|nr:class I SAM-dependent methyltransferase [Ectobacillus antri]MDG4655467.1 class I SAM-dependent methyltransferase [Ectobacillus antri]MDG5753225.1 class I SAM-dependent methyltransferase [Ectobacillus antri]
MSYQQFALLYDELMNDVPYDKWVSFVERKMDQYDVMAPSLLDVACGTGSVALPLMQKGYDVTGVDLSDDMLSVAYEKVRSAGYDAAFYQQDMRELSLDREFDCVTIFCDSLNYVTSEDGIKQTFKKVYEHVKPGGLFLFDIHSLYKIHQVFMNETYTINEEEVALIWTCFPGEEPDSVEHDMTFFVQDGEYYQRFDELHVQRGYETDHIISWLEEAGFTVLCVEGDFTEELTDTTERIFFTAQKKPR